MVVSAHTQQESTSPLPTLAASGPLSTADTLARGVAFLTQLQQEEGYWEGEAVWCPMITAQYVMTAAITGQPISDEKREGFTQNFRYYQLHDGSWGLHADGHGYLFVTALVYVGLRLLGHDADDPMVAKARTWIQARGGVLAVPTWGKVWLSLMNLYGWDGVNPVLPELWLLPDSNPIHPRRYYCHTRMIYLGIGVLYAQKLQHPVTPLIESLRQELYCQPFETISFVKHRNDLFEQDMFAWPTALTRMGYEASRWFDKIAPGSLRRKALDRCMEIIEFELHSTNYACISPVNGLLNTLAVWAKDPNHPDFLPAFETLDHWLWADDQEGYRYTGARSHTWDTSFVVQALCAGPLTEQSKAALQGAFQFLDRHQIQIELEDGARFYRTPMRGGYCFSDKRHQWPVSDCTAEALEALHLIEQTTGARLPTSRLVEAAQFLLLRQNDDGGWGSYEPRRGNWFLEKLNPSEMYGNCMLEHSYIECTASCIHGLTAFLSMVVEEEQDDSTLADLAPQVRVAIRKGEGFLRQAQLDDGSWPGFWGVNYTYGTLFGVVGLLKAGVAPQDPAIQRAVAWVKQAQLTDGGWGEDWRSCMEDRYIPSPQSQVIQTSWALMTLLFAGEQDLSVLEPAVALLQKRQMDNGDWPKEAVAGVFFNTAMLHYNLYKNYFPVWALGLYETFLCLSDVA